MVIFEVTKENNIIIERGRIDEKKLLTKQIALYLVVLYLTIQVNEIKVD